MGGGVFENTIGIVFSSPITRDLCPKWVTKGILFSHESIL